MFVVDDYIALVSSNLAEKDDLLLAYLRKVSELKISPDVKNLLFILYIEPSRFDLTFVLFAYDNHANEVMGLTEGGNFVSSVSSQEISLTFPCPTPNSKSMRSFMKNMNGK